MIKKPHSDKGYGRVRNIVKSHGVKPVIPFKGIFLPKDSLLTPDDFYNVKLYKKRNIRFLGD